MCCGIFLSIFVYFVLLFFFFFFFSSRRRHTRCSRDWSSDVCSSDLKCRGCRRLNVRCERSPTLRAGVVGNLSSAMRINFLLPFYPKLPIGGFKVHYEYANRLAERGHSVSVLHPCTVEEPTGWKANLSRTGKLAVDFLSNQETVGWYPLRNEV